VVTPKTAPSGLPSVARFQRDERGLSEIVGTLMLVLIVVAAATTFSIFVASYQKQLQQEQSFSQQQHLESLKVLRVSPTANANGTSWATLNLTVASEYINPSTVTQIRIDDNPLKQYGTWRLSLQSGSFVSGTVGAGGQLQLDPREQMNVLVTFGNASVSSFYNANFSLPTNGFIKVELFTSFQNDFQALFLPPTAIAVVTTLLTWNGSAYVPVPVLDGSGSFQPGNATLVSWTWHVTPENLSYSGEKAVVAFNPAFVTHNITLTVENSDDLTASETIHYP
jgi:flagellin-like protein